MDANSYQAFEVARGIEHAADRPAVGEELRHYLVSRYDHLLQRLSYRLGCADLARDSLHDTWLRLGDTSLPAMVRHPEAYVLRMACNVAVDRLRGERHGQAWAELDELEELADPAPRPDHIAEARSDLAVLERILGRLPYRHQAILRDLRIDESPRAAVALKYGLSTRRIDTVLRQSLEHCVAEMQGASSARRPRHTAR